MVKRTKKRVARRKSVKPVCEDCLASRRYIDLFHAAALNMAPSKTLQAIYNAAMRGELTMEQFSGAVLCIKRLMATLISEVKKNKDWVGDEYLETVQDIISLNRYTLKIEVDNFDRTFMGTSKVESPRHPKGSRIVPKKDGKV